MVHSLVDVIIGLCGKQKFCSRTEAQTSIKNRIVSNSRWEQIRRTKIFWRGSEVTEVIISFC